MRSKVETVDGAIGLMRGGRILQQTRTKTGPKWFLVPDGGEVSPGLVAQLLERGEIRSLADGLFPGIGQTYEMVAGRR
jgi:hypothetical protein